MEDPKQQGPFDIGNLIDRLPFDMGTARQNLKRGCRHCGGKGYQTLHTPLGKGPLYKNGPVQTEEQYCKCVIKNLRKQLK